MNRVKLFAAALVLCSTGVVYAASGNAKHGAQPRSTNKAGASCCADHKAGHKKAAGARASKADSKGSCCQSGGSCCASGAACCTHQKSAAQKDAAESCPMDAGAKDSCCAGGGSCCDGGSCCAKHKA